MNRFHSIVAGTLCMTMLLGTLSGCAAAPEQPGGAATTDAASDNTAQSTTTESPDLLDLNPITGEHNMTDADSDRPVGVMIANNDFIQDAQVGIADADMWMEAETEAGITRIMAVFANSSRIPASIGPVRSARSPFVHVAEALGLAYCHAGGSAPAISNISASDIADLNLDTGEGSYYSWRDEEYHQVHDYEFCLRTNGENLTRFITDRRYSTNAVRPVPWTFADEDGEATGDAASRVDIRMSDAQDIRFVYDSENGLYDKYNGSDEIRHCDIAGTPIRAANVLVLYTDKFRENEETIDFYLQSGTGRLFSQGLSRTFEWTRSSSGFIMSEQNGDKLTLPAGKVYLCVVSSEFEDSLSFS